ncbi:MAG: glycosyl hydrolase [Acidobacteria bacterium]|nr:MAG: glycosyl hydrolase [Acidobacteriota bacterium]
MFKSKWFLLASGLLLTLPLTLAAQVPVSQLTAGLHWRSVGPYTGGRVTTLAGIPSQPNVFFEGTAGGGVWETTNYGSTWENISDKYFKVGSIGAMAIAPSNPKIIYVGTGDSAPRNTVTTGEGMYKSTDGGKTWQFTGLGNTHIISWILIDPQNPNIVYAAALGHLFGPNPERGVFKSTDGGQTWQKILYVNDHTGAITMAMDPSKPQVVYAAMWQMRRRHWGFSSGGPGSGIYKTTDGGAHWTNITHNPGLPTGIFGKVGLAVSPSDPSVVYALIQADYKGQAGGLFRSDNAGQTWNLISLSQDITQRAFYYGRVYADPKDPNTVYLPNVGVYISHDAGKKLITLRPPHGDNHAFWVNPDNTQIFIEGNDGGATVTRDGGKTWSSEDNQPTGQFYHANLDDQFPFHIYGAQQDRGSDEGSSATPAAVWTTVRGGEMSWVVPQPGKPWITYASGYYSDEYRGNRRTGFSQLVSPWPAFKFGDGGRMLKYRFGWNHHAAVFNPHNPSEFVLGAQVLLVTTDQGIHWKAISPDLTRNDRTKQLRPGGPISKDVTGEEMFDTISSIAFSPLTDGVIWTGSDDGLVYLTRNHGAHWSEVRPPQLPEWSTITCVEPSNTQPGTAYVSASRFDWDDFHPYIYKTTDYGKTWTPLTTGLPDNEYVESVRQDPNDPDLLFAATSRTVYFSLNGGAQWQPLSLNLPAVRVDDIEIQPQQHAVVLATFGRAFWVLDDLQYLEQLNTASVTASVPYLFKPQQSWEGAAGGGGFGFGGRGGPERRASGATVFFYLPSDYTSSTPVKLTFTTADGQLINSYTLPLKPVRSRFGGMSRVVKLHPGMNRFQWNLRYADAVEVKGIYHYTQQNGPITGPEVVPGTYDVKLTVGSSTVTQPLTVTLNPNLPTTQAELQARFDLLMGLRNAANKLDTALNRAIDARAVLQKDVRTSSSGSAAAQPQIARLTTDINDLVNLHIQSGEGSLVFRNHLRSWLFRINSRIDRNYLPLTSGMIGVAHMYIQQADAGAARLQADLTAGKVATAN